jgi:hypothetical protein
VRCGQKLGSKEHGLGLPAHGTAPSQSPLYICAEPLLLQGQLEVARKGSLGLRHPQAAPLVPDRFEEFWRS